MVQNNVLGLRTACALVLALAAATATAADAPTLAIRGFCPVSIVQSKQWVAGDESITTVFDGHEYRFASEKDRETFLDDPVAFAPAFGGDCIVTWKRTGKRVPGKLEHGVFYDGRMFLTASAKDQDAFRQKADEYGLADLAFEGRSPIALVKDGETVRGKAKHALVHDGFRYHFATTAERKAFLADPQEYAVDGRHLELAMGEATIDVAGKSACAFCDHKVWPLLSEGELGLAVEAKDGTVYVVEHAETKYVDLYNARFDGITLRVEGREIKRQGKFVWVVPDRLVKE